MSNHYQVEIEQQPIELYKLLKIANLVSGGGEAKVVISEGYVLLNGEVETQKRKKIFSGDMVEFNGDLVEFICHNEAIILTKDEKKAEKEQNAATQKNQLAAKEKSKKHNNKSSGKKNKASADKSKNPNKSESTKAPQVIPGQRRSIKFG
ncbi:MAG: RNA-binding S4 domain-containing protein [Thalassotalea sp.]